MKLSAFEILTEFLKRVDGAPPPVVQAPIETQDDLFIPPEDLHMTVYRDKYKRVVVSLKDMRDESRSVIVPAETIVQIANYIGVIFDTQSNAPKASKEYH